MNREEINMIFDWLEENVNKQNWYYFKLTDGNQITAYWKESDKTFAQFYVKSILKCVESEVTDDNYN